MHTTPVNSNSGGAIERETVKHYRLNWDEEVIDEDCRTLAQIVTLILSYLLLLSRHLSPILCGGRFRPYNELTGPIGLSLYVCRSYTSSPTLSSL